MVATVNNLLHSEQKVHETSADQQKVDANWQPQNASDFVAQTGIFSIFGNEKQKILEFGSAAKLQMQQEKLLRIKLLINLIVFPLIFHRRMFTCTMIPLDVQIVKRNMNKLIPQRNTLL